MSNPTFAVSTGLLYEKHRKKIGPALWVFLVLVDMQTSTSGEINFGAPVPTKEIAGRLGLGDRVVKAHLHQLEEEKYITLNRAQYGFVITVANPKKRFRREERKRTSGAPSRQEENRTSETEQTGTKPDISSASNVRKSSHLSSISSNIPPKGGSASPNDAPSFALQPPNPNRKLDSYGVLAAIAEAGGLPRPSRPLEKDLGQAKQFLKANPELTAEQIKLTVRHLLTVDPSFWNHKHLIDPATVRKFLPIVLAEQAKSTTQSDGYFDGFETAGGAA